MNSIDPNVSTPDVSAIVPDGPPVAPTDDARYRAKAKEAAEKFESFFIGEVMKQMRRGTKEIAGDDGMFQDKLGDDMLGMADTMVADALSGQHAFGVADAILRQLLPPETPSTNVPVSSTGLLNGSALPVASDKKNLSSSNRP